MNIIADLHVHTIASGHAFSTVLEIVQAAQKKGLHAVAITDHGPQLPGGPHRYHFTNLAVLPEQIEGVRVLKGVETNIIGMDGQLDLDPKALKKLELVWAGFHPYTGYEAGSVEDNTRAMIAVMQNPFVDGIVHPGNPRFAIDPERVVRAAKDTGVVLEINNNSFRARQGSQETCTKIASLAVSHGVPLMVNSDSHIAFTVGEVPHAWELIEAVGVPNEQIINTSVDRLNQFIAGKKQRRLRANQSVV